MANRHLISNKKKYEKALKEALKESEKSIALKPDEVLYFCQAADISNTLGHKAKALGFIYQAGKIQIANGAREEDIASDFIEESARPKRSD
ncbi:MAG UNVERIFIED_CONTAM: hypothetical protein LVQ98_04770 [Rickettsiaceae bacterium]|jgi:hypothetical protein